MFKPRNKIQAFRRAQKLVYSYSIIVLFTFSAIVSFPHWASERWYWYGSVLLLRSTLLTMLLCLASYVQCSTWLLKVLHKCFNTDMLGVLLIYPHSPLGTQDRAYISIKPLTAMLQYILHYRLLTLYTCLKSPTCILIVCLLYFLNKLFLICN